MKCLNPNYSSANPFLPRTDLTSSLLENCHTMNKIVNLLCWICKCSYNQKYPRVSVRTLITPNYSLSHLTLWVWLLSVKKKEFILKHYVELNHTKIMHLHLATAAVFLRQKHSNNTFLKCFQMLALLPMAHGTERKIPIINNSVFHLRSQSNICRGKLPSLKILGMILDGINTSRLSGFLLSAEKVASI